MAFRKKVDHILKYSPDILIIPESEHIDKIIIASQFRQPSDMLWFGHNRNKGLAVFAFGELKLSTLEVHREEFKMVVPIAVTGASIDFNLFAVWANNPQDHDGHYVTQVWKAINHYNNLLTEKAAILVGDFNSNTIWDKKRKIGNHSGVVRFLTERGIVSAYHSHHKQVQGKEIHPTYYMHRSNQKPYHIDYCFVSMDIATKIKTVAVGDFESWVVAKLSDHVPVIFDFDF